MKHLTRIILATCCLSVGMCSEYQSHVAARTIGIQGQYDKTTGGASGGFTDRVEYR